MLEVFVMSMCIYTTPPACESAAVGYYKQSGAENAVTDKSKVYAKKYPVTTTLVAYTAAAAQGRLILNLGEGKHLTLDKNTSTVGLKVGF